MESRHNHVSSLIIFFFTLSVVGFNLISVVFPVLISGTLKDPEIEINIFELGFLGIPLFVTSLIILAIAVFYYKGKLPNAILRFIVFVRNFEISKKWTVVLIIIVLIPYVIFSIPEFSEYEGDMWGDFKKFGRLVESWPSPAEGLNSLYILHVKNFFLKSSEFLFLNIRIIPFLASISVLLLTYFVTKEIANKRFAGFVSLLILIQSPVFLRFDTLATYSNFWVLFYLLSFYLISKAWFLSPISFVASIFSKTLTLAFLPMILYSAANSRINKKGRIALTIFYGGFFLFLILAFLFQPDLGRLIGLGLGNDHNSFNFEEFILGFTIFSYHLSGDWFVLLFILPLIVGLFLLARKGIVEANSIQVQLAGILLMGIFLEGFFEKIFVESYRFMPFLAFFAIGVGILFTKQRSNLRAGER